ncbi:protein PAIR1 isoform X2 [Brachypodium distachyon]|uniref:protein PAIR1 isoform X2 n=1 Tax=Brachypodium distachyon TaxID=15368 RepID=UPI000D0E2A47|nr:protein PAIR1 isoform X2 [Brachypodium distachyon]XP_024311506.1 protein PAIR1 isoform X2 [Brachypodium distachyon]|eukprot:XP_024311505.1 protein PAIR1 isoform X2 [Brachypodium distachyon]
MSRHRYLRSLQIQLLVYKKNPSSNWQKYQTTPSLGGTPVLQRVDVANEDAEHRFQQLANSVCRIEMVLDSVQNDVIQLNRSMKEASLDSDSIQRKVVLLDNSLQKILMVQDGEAGSIQQNDVLLDNSLQQILKGQDGLKELLEGGTKSNPDQLSVLNSHTSTLSEISSILSVWQEEIRADLRQLHGDIFRIFTKEMKGVVRAIRSLNSRPAALQMLEDRSCYPNERTWSSQVQVADGSPLMNQIPLANERLKMNQTPVSIGEPLMNLAVVANGSPLINQSPVANGRSQMNQTPVANGRPQMDRTPVANGRPHMEQITTNLFPARSSCSTKAADPKPNIEQGDVKATTPKLFGSSYMLAPKQGEVLNRKVNQQEPTKKAPVTIMIDSDDDSEGHASWVILNTEPADLMKEASREEGMQLLWSARKRSRRKRETRCIDATALPDVMRGKKRMGKAAPEAQEEEAVHVEAIPAKRTCRPNPKYDAEQWTA